MTGRPKGRFTRPLGRVFQAHGDVWHTHERRTPHLVIVDGMPCEKEPIAAPHRLLDSKWRMGEPDAVLGMLPEGEYFTVPKVGEIPYQHFEITSPFREDKWVLATEVRPGAGEVVHHVNVLIRPPDDGEDFISRMLKRRGAAMRLTQMGQTVEHESLAAC